MKMDKLKQTLKDMSLWSLVLCNIITIVWAMVEGWTPAGVIWVYWFQTLALSIFASLRILRFKVFVVEELRDVELHFFKIPKFDFKKHAIVPDQDCKKSKMRPLLFGLCFFHFLYYLFLINEMKAFPTLAILTSGFIFFVNQLLTFYRQKRKDMRSKVNIRKYEGYNMLRIIPIHISILFAVALRDFGGSIESKTVLLFFLILKSTIDVIMYVYENKAFQGEVKYQNGMMLL